MKIKICGLSTKEAVDTAVESGATHLGFILSPSKRQVAPEKFFKSQTMSQKQSKSRSFC